MASRSSSSQRRSSIKKSPAAKSNSSKLKASKLKIGRLPEWNLADLYSAIDAPEVGRDLDRLDAESIAFEKDYKGKLAEETAKNGGGAWLVRRRCIYCSSRSNSIASRTP